VRWLPLVVLSGCLLALPPPHGRAPDCVSEACPDGYVCDLETDECLTFCDLDDHCQDGLVCSYGSCVAECEDENCPHGLTCEPFSNSCKDTCDLKSDCREGWRCCTNENYDDSECDQLGYCFR
jgi:hypothetical protein